MESSLKNQLEMTQKAEAETNFRCKNEEKQLEDLRSRRKELKRDREI